MGTTSQGQGTCARCGAEFVPQGIAAGYAVTPKGERICYACCAAHDREVLETGDRWTGYILDGGGAVGNWPGSLRIETFGSEEGKGRGFGGEYQVTRVWFRVGERWWYGVNAGDNDIVRCRVLKSAPRWLNRAMFKVAVTR